MKDCVFPQPLSTLSSPSECLHCCNSKRCGNRWRCWVCLWPAWRQKPWAPAPPRPQPPKAHCKPLIPPPALPSGCMLCLSSKRCGRRYRCWSVSWPETRAWAPSPPPPTDTLRVIDPRPPSHPDVCFAGVARGVAGGCVAGPLRCQKLEQGRVALKPPHSRSPSPPPFPPPASLSHCYPTKPLFLPLSSQQEVWQEVSLLDRFVARNQSTGALLAKHLSLFSGIFAVHPPHFCNYLVDRKCEMERLPHPTDPAVCGEVCV